jgi:SNF2 family DNA or RNA helicase
MVKTLSIKQNPINKLWLYMAQTGYTLYPYQKEGVKWMLEKETLSKLPGVNGGLLCDEPGLGKTIQTCACIHNNRNNNGEVKRTLLILPQAVVSQWVNAITQIIPDAEIYMHLGTNRCRTIAELFNRNITGNWRIAITTFGMIYKRVKNCKDYMKQKTILHSITWDRIVIDEIHYIRNAGSKTAKLACLLRAKHKWGLTGTPIQNSCKDLISLYRFIGIPNKVNSPPYLDSLNKIYMKRRTKKMVEHLNSELKLPTLFQENIALEFYSDEERTIYNKIMRNVSNQFRDVLDNQFIQQREKMVIFFELLLRLRQVSIHPQLVINGYRKKFQKNFKTFTNISTKFQKIIELISDCPDENCLVFCHFSDEIKILGEHLSKNTIGWNKYDGSMNSKEREKCINDFVHRGKITDMLSDRLSEDCSKNIQSFSPRVLLIQINAGGVGLNLQQFSRVFITSPNWNPSNEIQAIARAHRIGQKRPVTVYRFSLYDNKAEFSTIDERICQVQTNKRNIMADLLDDEELRYSGEINLDNIKNKNIVEQLGYNDMRSLLE